MENSKNTSVLQIALEKSHKISSISGLVADLNHTCLLYLKKEIYYPLYY